MNPKPDRKQLVELMSQVAERVFIKEGTEVTPEMHGMIRDTNKNLVAKFSNKLVEVCIDGIQKELTE